MVVRFPCIVCFWIPKLKLENAFSIKPCSREGLSSFCVVLMTIWNMWTTKKQFQNFLQEYLNTHQEQRNKEKEDMDGESSKRVCVLLGVVTTHSSVGRDQLGEERRGGGGGGG